MVISEKRRVLVAQWIEHLPVMRSGSYGFDSCRDSGFFFLSHAPVMLISFHIKIYSSWAHHLEKSVLVSKYYQPLL